MNEPTYAAKMRPSFLGDEISARPRRDQGSGTFPKSRHAAHPLSSAESLLRIAVVTGRHGRRHVHDDRRERRAATSRSADQRERL